MKTLQTKVLIGLLPTLAILVGLGLWAIAMFYRLGGNIDVILRENYASIQAAEGMKEAIDRMDSGLLLMMGGQPDKGRALFEANRARFEENLKTEKGNITLPGEQALADSVETSFREYLAQANHFFSLSLRRQAAVYSDELKPGADRTREAAHAILALNHGNMMAMDLRARNNATNSIRLMIGALIAAVGLALGAALHLSRSILRPIQAVTDGARAMARGELDQLVPAASRDELGDLANAFNEMARTLRDYRQAGTARLLRAQKTAQATIDSFPDPVVVVDPVGAIEQANRGARLLGVSPAAEPRVAWEPVQPLQPLISDVLAGHGDYLPLSLEQAIPLHDGGQERYYLPRVVAIRTEHDELIGAAAALADVTKFHLLDRLKSDMVATVSHELKTPLTSVQMAIHLLLEEVIGPLTPKQVELLLAARQDAERILTMINDLLDLTRIEQGRVRLDLEPLPAGELVDEAVARLQPQAQVRGVTLTGKVEGLDPTVMVDRDRIEHVFDNLIVNAIQHTHRGGTVNLMAVADGGNTRFVVEDNGEGIPPEHLSRLFEKFYRVPTAQHSGGAGLGLAIVREIITAHGGEIGVESQPRKGTRFTVALPAVGMSDEEAPSLGGEKMGSTKRVLIVDDEPNVRLMLETALVSVGYAVSEAADGQAALERLGEKATNYDLIVLDLLMPRMDGMELLRRLRAGGNIIPVVILTAHGSIPEAVEAMKLGAIDFLTKPTKPDALRRVVAEVIERHAVSHEPHEPAESVPTPSEKSRQLAFELVRAKRAINRGQFSEAETLLRNVVVKNPSSADAHELLDRLLNLKAREARGIVSHPPRLVPQRDRSRQKLNQELIMMALITLATGLVFFGLFFAMVAACDHL